ncbi:MAG: DUF2520 domain-containing protein [Alphaproteobacteria bacterium]|nr:DUF2520 domain-containing protein [Alphaproteobacteria bacterium]
MRITIVGAGNVATHLAQRLKQQGCDIVQIWSRTRQSADTLAGIVGASATTDIGELLRDVDMFFFCVKDNVLTDLISNFDLSTPALMVHTAGSMPMSVFEGHSLHYGVMYPLQTFSRARSIDFSEVPCFIEAIDDYSLRKLETVANLVTTKTIPLDSENRKRLHLAAVFACNFTNHCYDLAQQLLESANIPFEAILPLIDETANKVHEMSPHEAQTGPAVRYDLNVISKQMSDLSEYPTMKGVYRIMTDSIHSLFE